MNLPLTTLSLLSGYPFKYKSLLYVLPLSIHFLYQVQDYCLLPIYASIYQLLEGSSGQKVFPFSFFLFIYLHFTVLSWFPWVWQAYVNSNPVPSGPYYFQVVSSYSFKFNQATLSSWIKLATLSSWIKLLYQIGSSYSYSPSLLLLWLKEWCT